MYLPAAHPAQSLLRACGAWVPAAHGVAETLPATQEVPAGQPSHSASALSIGKAPNVPAGQLLGDGLPCTQNMP